MQHHGMGRMTDLNALINSLIAAHRTGHQITPPDRALSRDEVFQVQQEVAANLGPVAGFKVGRANDPDPILAPLPACYKLPDGGTYAFRDSVGVELEVGFEVIRPFTANALPDNPQHFLRPCVVLELVNSRFNSENLSQDAKFCDFQLHGGLVVGQSDDTWNGQDFGVVQGHLTVGSHCVLNGEATIPGGSAFANLSALLTHLGTHCGGVQLGQILITGSLNGLPYFHDSALVKGQISGLGLVSAYVSRAGETE
jgi:2-keto-4-pentenoate hydratase